MGVWADLLGPKLQGAGGTEVASDTLSEHKAVGIYFSAHWCPPCRMFTPKLAEWYKKDLKSKGFEVVFVSSDKDDSSFKEYFGEMPWLSLPFAERDFKDQLSKKFKVSGIPSFVILDGKDATTISLKGREAVESDPVGESFPWRPKPLKELFGTEFIDANGPVDISAFAGKKIGLYFSAHWCPPCKAFTPKLAEIYKAFQEKGVPFEIVFASSDRDEEGFKSYFAEMPWKAIPYADRSRKDGLSSHFDVNGIPCLVILDEDLSIINRNATGKVRSDPEGAKFPWGVDLVNEIDQDSEGIEDLPSLVVLQEKLSEEEKSKNLAAVSVVAEKYKALAKQTGGDEEFNFFVAGAEGSLANRVRSECKIGTDTDTVKVIMMDIGDNGGYYDYPGALTSEGIEQFFADYKVKKLERKQMG